MGTGDDITLPLINQQTLEHLDAEVNDAEGYWKVFVRNYLDLLPTRTERIRLALTTADLDTSLDAVLSLKTSSQMIGAERLASLAGDLEIDIRTRTRENNPVGSCPSWLQSKFIRFVVAPYRQDACSGSCWRSSGPARCGESKKAVRHHANFFSPPAAESSGSWSQ